MKNLFALIVFSFLSAVAFAQANSDSLAYQLQRNKINTMLAERTQKFGKYDESLKMHTGIFGFQSKNDIRRSNDILMDIVKTDDSIYTQLKILLDYRAFQQTQVVNHSKETEENTIGFMATINKLRQQAGQLKADAKTQQAQHEKTKNQFIIVIMLLFALILYLISRSRKR
jgi:hypothetical protein